MMNDGLRRAGAIKNKEDIMVHIKEGTIVYELIVLLACVGEFPMQSIYLLGNNQTWKARIRELEVARSCYIPDIDYRIRAKLLTVSNKKTYKTLRLFKSALPILKKLNPDAYDYYLAHFDGHHFSGASTHVDRNHRVAEAVAMCLAAGIPALPWETYDLQDPNVRDREVEQPCFFNSRDLKEFYGDEMNKTEFTRLTGAIVYPRGMYAVYNTRDSAMIWGGKGEEKAQVLLSAIFRSGGYRDSCDSAILFGKDFDTAAMTMEDSFTKRYYKERLDKIYQHLHFIPMNEFGIKLLQIITTKSWKRKLREAVYGDAPSGMAIRGLEHDVYIDGEYHFSHLDSDLCRLIWFRRTLRNKVKFVLACYPDQVPYLEEYFGDYWDRENLRVELYNLDALHAYLCEELKTENK